MYAVEIRILIHGYDGVQLLIQTFGFLSRQARGSVEVDGDTYAPSLNDDQSSDDIGIGGHLQQFWLDFRWA